MSGDADWWARQLGQQAPQQRHEAPTNYQPQLPQQQQAPQYQTSRDATQQHAPGAEPLTMHNFFEAASTWQGGQATKTEVYACPQCNGNHFFTRQNGPSRGPAPAPLCMDCGYTGLFEQADAANWGAGG